MQLLQVHGNRPRSALGREHRRASAGCAQCRCDSVSPGLTGNIALAEYRPAGAALPWPERRPAHRHRAALDHPVGGGAFPCPPCTMSRPRARHNVPVTAAQIWSEQTGVAVLPSGAAVRGRRVAATASPADFALLLDPARSRPGHTAGSRRPTSGCRSIGRTHSTRCARLCVGHTTVNASRWPAAAGSAGPNGVGRSDPRRPACRAGGALGPGGLPPEGCRDTLAATLAAPRRLRPASPATRHAPGGVGRRRMVERPTAPAGRSC